MSFLDKKFQKRLASAAVLAPVSFLLILYGSWPFALFVLTCAVMSFYEWSRLAAKTKHQAAFIIFGIIYIPICYWCCYLLRIEHSASIALLFICMVWASDIGAYFMGRTLGGPKLAPKLSPKKTWAGFYGAMIAPSILSMMYLLIASGSPVLILGLMSGILIGSVGQAGDLLVSFLKRQAEQKDASELIPGHGGLLDRVDAMMLAAPVFLFIVSKYAHVF